MKDFRIQNDTYNVVDLYKGIIDEMFSQDHSTFDDVKDILIDLDSCLSILTHERIPWEGDAIEDLIQSTIVTLARFLEKWKNTANIKIYYSFKPTKRFSEFIPEWDNERNTRLKEKIVYTISDSIIRRLKKINLDNIGVIECEDSTIIDITEYLLKNDSEKRSITILSRDPHYNCLLSKFKYLEIYNGRHMYNGITIKRIDHTSIPKVPRIMFPYYYAIAGMVKHQYKGLPKYGPKMTGKILNSTENVEKIIKKEHPILEELGNKIDVFLVWRLIK